MMMIASLGIWSRRSTQIHQVQRNIPSILSNLSRSTRLLWLLLTMLDDQDPAKTHTHQLHYENVRCFN